MSQSGRRVLDAAADRPGNSLLPLPSDVPARGAVRQRLLAGLLQAGHAQEAVAVDHASTWRTDETRRGMTLILTDQGFAAVGRTPTPARRKAHPRRSAARTTEARDLAGAAPLAGAEAAGAASDEAARPAAPDARPERHPGGKLGRVLAALATDAGAALPELAALTGWQPHTTRAALTRLRQRGYALERLKLNGRAAYRLRTAG